MLETKHVRDYSGKLIPRDKARRIDGKYYEEGASCILMPDGQWYRTTTDKIRFDWEKKTWVFAKEAENLIKGLVDDGTLGYFSQSKQNVVIYYKKDSFERQVRMPIFEQTSVGNESSRWNKSYARSADIAEKFGYMESLVDGKFFKKSEMSASEIANAKVPGTPQNERSNTYSLDDDPAGRKAMEEEYKNYSPKLSSNIHKLAKLIPFTFGLEFESSVGHIPARLRGALGVRPLRDGSINGIEYVTIPLEGAKGINTIKELCTELTKRCLTNNQCSVHVHFGNVRRDKVYILALYQLARHLQDELLGYFPFTRTNSIRNDGKVYCKPLEHQGVNLSEVIKAVKREDFQGAVNVEFNKIYSWLNNNRGLGEEYERRKERQEKMMEMGGRTVKAWRLQEKSYHFSTKTRVHSIRGNKWDRPQRYYWMNLLPTFFGPETIEFRPHEATFSYERTLIWMLTCSAILQYANDIKQCLTASSITLNEVLTSTLPKKVADHIMKYYMERKKTFKEPSGKWRKDFTTVENNWLESDKNYKFNNISIEELL